VPWAPELFSAPALQRLLDKYRRQRLRSVPYQLFFSNGGGIPLEHCAVTDDGRACALEYNVVAWGRTALSPGAGLAVYVRGDSGKLAAARVYDDSDPPLSVHA
jgi:hypothetical protein